VACNCGTSALHVSLILAGVGQTTRSSCRHHLHRTHQRGAVRRRVSVFVDCDDTAASTSMASALPRRGVHHGRRRDGQQQTAAESRRSSLFMCSVRRGHGSILDWLTEHLAVIEDASEALGSRYKDRMCGALAPMACLSFNGNKIVTSGEAARS